MKSSFCKIKGLVLVLDKPGIMNSYPQVDFRFERRPTAKGEKKPMSKSLPLDSRRSSKMVGPDQIGRNAAACPVIFCAEVSCSAGPRGLHFHLWSVPIRK